VHKGRISQFGDTAQIYRAPENLTTAEVFSDPPINSAPVTKQGGEIRLSDDVRWPAAGAAAGLADGAYTVAIRPHFVTPTRTNPGDLPLNGVVRITELSGSESVAHFDIGARTWVSLSNGVHPYNVGSDHQFYVDVSRCLYFGADGKLAA
jgi:glycerol transport system ATP-binding protein